MRKFLAFCLIACSASLAGQAVPGTSYVFFDFSKTELSNDSKQTLDGVAAAYVRSPGPLLIDGHSDRSGPAPGNIIASRRRAEQVRDYLLSKGLPASALKVRAFGESRPLVPTEDGVREAQNRRVELRDEVTIAAPRVTLHRGDGSAAGYAAIYGNWLTIEATGLAPGRHGLHLHAVGRCEGSDFASAGPHWNPANRKHGSENPEGPHDGDLPNLEVGANGRGSATMTIDPHSVDDDGAALVIHASPDDYRTDPSGNSGARVACAAFTR